VQRLSFAGILIGSVGIVIAYTVDMDAVESLVLQMYFYIALFGAGLSLSVVALIIRKGLSTAVFISILLNACGCVWKCEKLYRLICDCRSRGWL